jgi:hypothetical protein
MDQTMIATAPADDYLSRGQAETSPAPPHGAETQILHVRLADDVLSSCLGDDAQLGLRSSSRQDWNRAASVDSAGTPGSSIRIGWLFTQGR